MRTPFDVHRSLKDYVYEMLGEPYEVRLADEDGTFERPFAMVWPTGDQLTSGGRYHPDIIQPFQVTCYPAPAATPEESLALAARCEDALWRGFKLGVGLLAVPKAPLIELQAGGAFGPTRKGYCITARNRYGETTPSPASWADIGAGDLVQLSWERVPGAQAYRVYRGDFGGPVYEFLAEVTGPAYADAGDVPTRLPNPPLRNRARVGHPNRVPLYSYDDVPVLTTMVDPLPWRSANDYATVRDYSSDKQRDDADPTLYTVTASVRLGWRRAAEVPSAQTVESVTTRPA